MHWRLKIFFLVAGLAVMFPLAGCATNTQPVPHPDVSFELVGSKSAVITRAWLVETDASLVLRGEVSNRFPVRAPIPGYLHIELLTPAGNVFKQATIAYCHAGIKSDTAHFQVAVPFDTSLFKTIRISHYRHGAHIPHPKGSPWRDPNDHS